MIAPVKFSHLLHFIFSEQDGRDLSSYSLHFGMLSSVTQTQCRAVLFSAEQSTFSSKAFSPDWMLLSGRCSCLTRHLADALPSVFPLFSSFAASRPVSLNPSGGECLE